jgi:hypothetical protein
MFVAGVTRTCASGSSFYPVPNPKIQNVRKDDTGRAARDDRQLECRRSVSNHFCE